MLTGPEASTHDDAAARLAEAAGRDVPYVGADDEAAREGLSAAGLPPCRRRNRRRLPRRELRAGAAERVTDDVPTLTGRPPRAFMAWAREHAPAFAPVASPGGT